MIPEGTKETFAVVKISFRAALTKSPKIIAQRPTQDTSYSLLTLALDNINTPFYYTMVARYKN